MKYNTILHPHFKKEFKSLEKKYPSLKADFIAITDEIEKQLALGIDLGDGFKKN